MALCQRGWRATGIDIAANAIKAAAKIVQARGLEAEPLVADATQWQPVGHHDLITNSLALPESQPERASVFRMIWDALAPGDTVLLQDFDSTMHRIGFFPGPARVTVDEFTAALAPFDIVTAQIVDTPVQDPDSDGRLQDERWTAAFLHAQWP